MLSKQSLEQLRYAAMQLDSSVFKLEEGSRLRQPEAIVQVEFVVAGLATIVTLLLSVENALDQQWINRLRRATSATRYDKISN
jgi:hypothetical protein